MVTLIQSRNVCSDLLQLICFCFVLTLHSSKSKKKTNLFFAFEDKDT